MALLTQNKPNSIKLLPANVGLIKPKEAVSLRPEGKSLVESRTALDFQTRGRYNPLVILMMGRRGGGKTLAMSGLADVEATRYREKKTGYEVWSNYELRFPKFCPPCKELYEARRRGIPLPPSDVPDDHIGHLFHPKLLDYLIKYPHYASRKLICIDELASAFPSRRAMANANVEFSNFLTQIRKLRSECIFTTQFPQVVDVQVLLQVDLFVRCKSIMGGKAVVMEFHDWWGQFTGDDSRKMWPPEPDTFDWRRALLNTDKLFGTYDTYEIIAPLASASRDEIIAHFYKSLDAGLLDVDPDDEDDEDEEDESDRITQEIIEKLPKSFEEALDALPSSFQMNYSLLSKAKTYLLIKSYKELATYLRDNGYEIAGQGNGAVVYKPASKL